MAKRCPGCMKLKEKSPVCEHCGYNEHVPNESHQLPIGTVLQGRYQIGKVLGQGGFGITYIGWDMSLETTVAIKEYYPSSFVNRDSSQNLTVSSNGSNVTELFQLNRERFLREARILAKLSHVPGIVRVQNLFAENNTAYIVMEYVEGIDLKRYIRMQGRTLTVEETFAVMRPIMYALSKVHDAELVHRDISPDNIMIQNDGSVILLDFGAAREVANADVHKDLTRSTQTILKHGFAPIEQYRSRGNLGPWTDVYALCATMYYCLTGKVPSEAPERVIGEDNVNWHQIPGLTQTQIAALEQGLAMIPEKRIQSVKELYQALFGQRATTVAQQPNKPEPPVEKTVEEPVKEPEKDPEKEPVEYPTHTVALEEPTPAPKSKTPPVPVKSVVMETKQQKKKPVWMIVAAVLVFAAIGLFAAKPKADENTLFIPETQPIPAITEPEEPIKPQGVQKTHIMMVAEDISEIDFKDRGDQFFWGQTFYPRSAVTQISFHGTIANIPEQAWDVSEAQDGTILAWMENEHHLHVAANGKIAPNENASFLFYYFTNLTSVDFGNYFDTTNVTNMREMFGGCMRLSNLDLSCFDTAKVTNMNNMFGSSSLTTLNMTGWDTSNVTDIGGMFFSCDFTELDLSHFNTRNVKNMSRMFGYNEKLITLDISSFDTSKVRYMSQMFSNCSSLRKLDLTCFDVYYVIEMNNMFYNCSDLIELDLSGFDTYNVTDMCQMFSGCRSLRTLDLSSFDTSKVRDMSHMFSSCSSLKELDLSYFDTENVYDLGGMFSGCSNLSSLDISNFTTSSLMSGGNLMGDHGTENIFSGCTNLKELKCSDSSILKEYRGY